ncbi:MAG: shikimate kinase [Actinomycetota bacterium]|nr:shikimate kinase [Actinomycetota bacterium]
MHVNLSDYKNISLIGFMGSGKTTIGKILAEKLGFLFIDIDRVIELKDGKKISDIFRIYGEDYFRNLETEVIKKIYKNKNCVFACGGGVIERKENVKLIRENSFVVYLSISPEVAIKRLKDVTDRPLIEVQNREKTIKEMIIKRDSLYRESAHLVINNDDISPDKASDEILKRFLSSKTV